MNRKPTGLVLIILTLLALVITPFSLLPAHAVAQTGTVCIAPGSVTTGCPPVPVGITAGTTVGSTFVVNVNIQGSAPQAGFEIYVKTNATLIAAATNTSSDVSITGSVVDSPSISTSCINNHPFAGNCISSLDGNGIVHLGVTSLSGILSSANGLLFSITYKVKSLATTVGSPIVYQTGCSTPSAPTSNDNQCVTIISSGVNPDPENLNTGTWIGSLGTYLLGAAPSVMTIDISGVQTSTINATQYNTFTFKNTPVTLSTTVSNSSVSNRPTATVSPTSISSTISTKANYNTATLTITVFSNTPAGVYFVSVNGTAAGQPARSAIVTVTVPTPDFAIKAIPNIVNQLYLGASGSSNITLVSQNNFTGTISLSALPPSGLSATLGRTSLLLKGGKINSTLLTVSSSTAADYQITVTATSGSLTHTVVVQVNVVDYSISASPSSVNVNQSSTNTTLIRVNAVNSFSGAVNVTATSPAGLTTQFNVTTVTGGSGISNLTIAANGAIAPGLYSVTVIGSSTVGTFNLIHQTTITVTVKGSTSPIFDVSATSPTPVNVGVFANSTITVTEFNSFSGTVNLSDTPPSGLNCKAINPTSVTVNTTNPTATAILSCTATVAGPNQVIVTGTSLGKTQSAVPPPFFNFTDFTVTVSTPSPFPANVGTSPTSKVTITGEPGFTGTVLLSTTPETAGLTCAQPSPSSLTLPPSPATATFSCTSNSPGAFNATVTATSGVITHTVKGIGFNFTDFTISATTPTLVMATQTTSTTISIAPLNFFNGTVTLSDNPLPNGLTFCSISPQIINLTMTASLSCSASVGGNYIVTITGTDNTLIHQTTATFRFTDFTITPFSPAPLDPTFYEKANFTLTGLNGFTGTIQVTAAPSMGLTCNPISPSSLTFDPSPQNTSLACTSATNGTFQATVTATIGTLTHTATAKFIFGKDFNITSQSPAPVNVNVAAAVTVTLNAINGFTGTVILTNSTSIGLTCNLSPASIVFGTTPQTATLSCKSSTAGLYNATITGTSGLLVHNTTVTFTIKDFTIAATSETTPLNIAVNSTITLTALTGFTGTIALTDIVPSGLTCNPINPSTITFGTTPQTAKLSCKSSVTAVYTVTINATIGGLFHTTTATFTIGTDFSITATSPAGISGQTITSTITLTSINGFAGTAIISTIPPSGLSCSLNPSSLTINSTDPTATAILSCIPVAAGNYTLTVTGTFSTLSHTATAKFTITDFTITPISIPATVIVGKLSNVTMAVTGQNGFTGTVSLLTSPDSGLTCQPISSSGTLPPNFTTTFSCTSAIAGRYSLTVTGSTTNAFGTAQRSKTITFNIIDFTISASNPTANPGTSSISTITLTGDNGFAGTISLSDTVPTGLSCNTLNPTSVSVPPDATASLSCTSTSPGLFQVIITATNGTLTHTITAVFTYSDFTISASQPATVAVGSQTNSTITLTGVNGLMGTISLSPPSAPSGVSCGSVSPSSLTFGTSPQKASFSCSSLTAGTYMVSVTGTIGSFSHTTTLTLTIADFSISISPTATLIVSQGGSNTTNIQLTNTGPVSENITLTAPVTPTGPGTSLSQTIVRLSPSQTASITLTVIGLTATPGSYTVLANATLYGLVRSPAVTVTIILPVISFVSVSTPSSTSQSGETVDVTVDVFNPSTIALSFNLTLDVNEVSVDVKPLTLQPGQDSGPIILTWDTTSYAAGNYTITVRLVDAETTGTPPISPQLAVTSRQAGMVQLSAAAPSQPIPGGLTTIVAIVLAVIAAIIVGRLLLRRRKPGSQTTTQA